MSILSDLIVRVLSTMPTPVMRYFSSKYIAGVTVEEALERLQSINDEGFAGILDILGEDADGERGARAALEAYKVACSKLAASKLISYVSAKPTHFGLRTGEDLCFEIYSALATHCQGLGQFLRVEMEDHTTTDGTLRVFNRLLQKHGNVGIVLQSRLFRNGSDIEALLAKLPADRTLNVRMVKGIYLEPSNTAHTSYESIARAYVDQSRQLFEGGAKVCLATHDSQMAEELVALVSELQIPKERYEFQVLMGVLKPIWKVWLDAGHPVRVYVPFGPDWKAYSLRRLKKNPKLLTQITLGIFRR